MALVVKENETHFEPAPPGLHRAVCVDVVDLGIVDGSFGPKRKVKVIWQLAAKNKRGERFQVRATYTQSLAEGSNLRRDLESWRSRSFTAAELKGFDLEKLIGVNCQLNVKHNVSKQGRTYAQATAVLPPAKDGEKLTPEDYEREPWPTQQAEAPPADEGPVDFQASDDDVPFGVLLAPLAGLILAGLGLA